MEARFALRPRLLKLASLSVTIGIAIQALIVGATILAGGKPTFASAVVGALGKMSWSTVVCVGVAVGLSLPRASYSSAAVWGFGSAQLAFHFARAMQHALGFALGQVASELPRRLLIGGSIIKAVQYGTLALALMWLKRRTHAGALSYAALGLVLGVVFGGALLLLHVSSTSQTDAMQLLPIVINEMVFPVLCALVIFATTRAPWFAAGAGPSTSTIEASSADGS